MIIKIIKKVTFFLILSVMILILNPNGLFTFISSAQETVSAVDGQKITVTEEPVSPEKVEKNKETEIDTESDLSLKADYITYEKIEEDDLVIAKDGVQLKYQDIEIEAEYLKINLTTHLLYASNGVSFQQDDTNTQCEELIYNWKTKKTILSKLKGEMTGEGIKGSLYYQGGKMENFPETIKITEGSFTTCELDEPHYHIIATEITIYLKDKIIARNISWYEGEKKILTLPYFLVFLDSKTQMPILPKIGQNSSDGWFVKTNFNYYIDEKSYGTLYIDWLEKKGIGIGAKHILEIGEKNNNPGETSIYFYLIKNNDTDYLKLIGKTDYEQEFENNIKTRITLDYTGTKSGNTDIFNNTLKSRFSLIKTGEKYNLKMTGKYDFKGQEIDSLDIKGNITLNYNYSMSDKISSALTLVYTEDNPADEEADLQLKPKWVLRFNGDGYTLNLLTEKRFDLNEDIFTEGNTSKTIDRLPEFIFKKNSATIGNSGFNYNLEGSIGHFYEGSTDKDGTRGEYIFNLKRPFTLGENLTLTPSGTFRQDVYSSGEARYLVGGKLELKAEYNPYISSTLTYNYNKSVGPTPFSFDYISPLSNTINAKLIFKPTEKINLNLTTNYNFITENFGSLVGKLEYKPKDDWKINLNTTYDLNNMEWSKRINSQLNVQLSKNWHVKYKGAFGLEDFKFSNSVIGITRDLHCRELTINYKQSTKSIWVEFFIKAFPTEKITIGG